MICTRVLPLAHQTDIAMPMPELHSGGAGEPMVLLHGVASTWRVWEPLLPALEARHGVLAPTLPGHHGGSALGHDTPVSMTALVEGIATQLDSEGIGRAHLVGNSLGGWIALELARQGRALSVVCICPAGGWEAGTGEERAVTRLFSRSLAALRPLRPWFATIARRPRLRAIAYRDAVADPSKMPASAALAGLEAAVGCAIASELVALTARSELYGELGPIACPIRIATATRDRIFDRPGHYAKLRRLLPDAEWMSLEGVGHLAMFDDPARTATAILDVTAGPGTRQLG